MLVVFMSFPAGAQGVKKIRIGVIGPWKLNPDAPEVTYKGIVPF